MEDPLVLGVDIGGSHITAGLVDLSKREIVSESVKHQLVDSNDSAEVILSSWCEHIKSICSAGDMSNKRIGIAIPGPFDYKKGICLIETQAKFRSLYKMDVRNALALRLGISEDYIQFVNDAAAFLQGEVFAGAAQGYQAALGITLGTGLGSALYINGKLIDAELWNSPFQTGTAEDFLAARWFVKRYQELSGNTADGVKEIAKIALINVEAKQVFREFGENFAQFLQPMVNRYPIDAIILGGNISYAFDHFSQGLIQGAGQWPKTLPVKVSNLKENAALIGAAARWYNKVFNGHGLLNYKRHEV